MPNLISLSPDQQNELIRLKKIKQQEYIKKLIDWQLKEGVVIIPVLRQTPNAIVADITLNEATVEQLKELEAIKEKQNNQV